MDIFNLQRITDLFRCAPLLVLAAQIWDGAITDAEGAPITDDAGNSYLSWDE